MGMLACALGMSLDRPVQIDYKVAGIGPSGVGVFLAAEHERGGDGPRARHQPQGHDALHTGGDRTHARAETAARIPLGRWVTPEDVSNGSSYDEYFSVRT